MDSSRLNIVDEQGNIVGEETREKIHRDGLLHRIVHVWFYTPDKKLIFQRRGKHAETYPNLLDASAGGHVERGQDYLQAAVAEAREETGVNVQPEELKLLGMNKFGPTRDSLTDIINHHLVASFAYLFRGKVGDLRDEQNEDGGLAFEAWPIEKLFSLTEGERKRFIPSRMGLAYKEIFQKIRSLAGE